ncbi:hypothetical protein COL26b_012745 [Colletotrichum chrysophilum]|uniref:uncharacterized protein n=1 Tax=Colletotrichum chrysophilum TaxID=1836956 RepID=UPI0023012915|nr:uncharacterized protein COL26b_012745 [Colletotrichum chrysophilum]KAJ0363875.1 hypothetical protein COL26b_012745 [Colletotrichum chrysophilum]
MHLDGSTEKHAQWGSPEAIADASSSSETEGSTGDESALPPVHLTQPDGTVVEINDTDKDQANPARRLDRVPSWRDNEDLSSAISQNGPTTTPSDGQTEVNDHGDTAQLRQGTTIPYSNATPSLENDFSNVGGASGLGDETTVAPYPLDLSDSGSEDGDGLWESIDEQLISPPPDDKEYLPLDQLRRIMVKRRVRKALKKHLKLDRDTRYSLIIWLAEQSAGIASGLKLIQHPPPNLELTVQDARDYGRHGDLKPENILWFRDPDAEESLIGSGLLKIADFGLTRYHRHNSRYQKLNSGGGFKCSLTYKAPEVDVVDSVSEAYDIWTLGCLLLEFITWYLRGWQAVDDFSARRASESQDPDHDIPLDTFFNVESKNGVRGAGLKRAVKELIDDLHEDANCSKFLHDLLTYTLHHLLRSDHKKRAKCVDVVKMLEKMASDCRNDKSYAVDGRMKPPNKSDTMDTTRTDKTVSEYGRNTAEDDPLTTPHASRQGTPAREKGLHDFVRYDEIKERVLYNDVMETDTDEIAAAEEPSENEEETPKQDLNVASQDVGPDEMEISTSTARNTTFLQNDSFSSSSTEGYAISQPNESGFGENLKRKSCGIREELPTQEMKRPKLAEEESTLVGSIAELNERPVAQTVEG